MTDTWDGHPENPERDGWHWLQDRRASFCVPVEWRNPSGWVVNNIPLLPDEVQRYVVDCCDYLGPCLTPAEVAAQVAAAYKRGQKDMRERAAQAIEIAICTVYDADTIRALPIKEAPHE